MANDKKLVNVQLLNKKLQVKAPAHQVNDLQKAAQLVDKKMREVRDHGTATGHEYMALMCAINLAYDLILSQQNQQTYIDSVSEQVQQLQQKIDAVMETKKDHDSNAH